jgi:hypothetical protein
MRKIALTVLAVALMGSMSLGKDKAPKVKSEKISGWVNDEKCAAKAKTSDHSDCAKKCVGAGEKLVIVSDEGHTVYKVDNQDALKGHEGHHVKVTATNNNGTLHVDKLDMLKDQGEKAADKAKPGM